MRISAAVRFSFMLLFLLIGSASAQLTPCPPTTAIGNALGVSGNILLVAMALAALALLVSFLAIAIIYIISRIVPGIGVGRWLESEYKELVKSAILIVVIFSVVAILGGVALSLTGNTTGTYATNVSQLTYQSEIYLCSVNSNLTNSLGSMLALQVGYGLFHSLRVIWPGIPIPPVPLPGWGALIPVFRSGVGFRPITSDLLGTGGGQYSSFFNDAVVFLEFPMITVYTSQLYLVPLFIAVGLALLIPIGIIFRAVPLIRSIGGTLIALGIGLAIVWPSLLILFNAPVSAYFSSVFSTQISSPANNGCSSLGLLSTPCNSIMSINILKENVQALDGAWYAMTTLVSIYPALNYILYYNLYLIFQFYFLFIIDLILAYSITDNIARLLGGSIRLSFGRRLKLI